MHPSLNMLHHGPVHQGVRVAQRRRTVNWVILLGPVQEQGPDDAVSHHGDGPVRALPARRGSAYNLPACLTLPL